MQGVCASFEVQYGCSEVCCVSILHTAAPPVGSLCTFNKSSPQTVDWTLWAGSSSAPTHLILFIHLGYTQCQCGSSLCCTWWLLQTSYALIGPGPLAPHTCNGIKLLYTWLTLGSIVGVNCPSAALGGCFKPS